VLLNSVFRLFFKRAPEMKKVLSAVFQEIMTNCTDIHIRQRAVMLYRLLQQQTHLGRQIAETNAEEFEIFFEDKNDECRERLFWEFNSLSVVYQKPCERFLKDSVLKQAQAAEKKYFPERVRKIKSDRRAEDEEQEDNDTPLISEKPMDQTKGNDLDDLLDLGGGSYSTQQQQQTY
jgi:type IV secretory pathway VirB3-like protein